MRDLMECQAEVFRRSEKRIKARKQRRNHMLMACVPLVICVTLAFALKPIMPSDQKTEPENTTQQESTGLPESSETMLSNSVVVMGVGVSNSFTSAEDFGEITGILASVTAKPEEEDREYGDALLGDANCDGNLVGGAPQPPGEYTITVKNDDGTETVYRLSDSFLVDQATNERFLLEPDTCLLLSNALGIPQN